MTTEGELPDDELESALARFSEQLHLNPADHKFRLVYTTQRTGEQLWKCACGATLIAPGRDQQR